MDLIKAILNHSTKSHHVDKKKSKTNESPLENVEQEKKALKESSILNLDLSQYSIKNLKPLPWVNLRYNKADFFILDMDFPPETNHKF